MFGIYNNSIFYNNVNYIILLANRYIHRQVYLERKINLFNFLIVFRSYLDTKNTYANIMVDSILLPNNDLTIIFNLLYWFSLLHC